MLDACDESSVYLGTKDGVKLDDLVEAFETAQETGEFDDEKDVYKRQIYNNEIVEYSVFL